MYIVFSLHFISYYFGKDRCRTYINNITLQIFNLTEHNFSRYIIMVLSPSTPATQNVAEEIWQGVGDSRGGK